MGRRTQRKSINAETPGFVSVLIPKPRYGAHTTLRLGGGTQVGTCNATRLDSHIPCALNGNAGEQDEEKCGGADDGKEGDEVVCVFMKLSVCGRYET